MNNGNGQSRLEVDWKGQIMDATAPPFFVRTVRVLVGLPLAAVGLVLTFYTALFEFALWQPTDSGPANTCNTYAPAGVFGGALVLGLIALGASGLLFWSNRPVVAWLKWVLLLGVFAVALTAIGLAQSGACP